MKSSSLLAWFVVLGGCSSIGPAVGVDSARGASPESDQDWEARTHGLARRDGFVPIYWDAAKAAVLIEVPTEETDVLYVESLRTGLGSNDVGLDRGQLGQSILVRFRRFGARVLLVAPNLAWRSSSTEAAEQRGAHESFAESVLWSFVVVAKASGDPERCLVDATDFLLRDAHGVERALANAGEGKFALDRERSVVLPDELRAFPENSELEVLQTWAGDAPGPEVRSTTPDPRAVSLRVHHSFVRLPVDPMESRAFHPRCGYSPLSHHDLAAPIDADLERRFITRHRLELDGDGRVVEPIVYYIDRAAPEPVRGALLEGARYWVPVFERAGFRGGFRAELLPEGIDVLDARYNVVQWVNRSTRGWSYGMSVDDPRSGEILKGHVSLGALRVRQDILLAEGLLSPYVDRDVDERVTEMALARLRQLSAHEIGHTLGLAHNFAASIDGRASVMDYPAPVVTITQEGELDLSDAYRDGCGEWDELAILYGYGAESLWDVLERMAGLHYLTDRDARGNDRAHPLANLWDNGADPLEEFAHVARVRRIALERFGESAIQRGEPLARLEEALVPLYLHHRYQLEAVARSLGGIEYGYELRPSMAPPRPVEAERQRRALEILLGTLAAEFLALPADLRAAIPPRPPGFEPHRELFDPGALVFDPLRAAAASADWTLALLLDAGRARRVLDQAGDGAGLPGLDEVLEALHAATWGRPLPSDSHGRALANEVRILTLERLLRLAEDPSAAVRVRAVAWQHGLRLRRLLGEDAEEPVTRWAIDRLRHAFEDPLDGRGSTDPVPLPPGSPIGGWGGRNVALGCGWELAHPSASSGLRTEASTRLER